MSEGLEDLKWLIESGYIEQHGWQEDVVMLDCVNNIEKELKALEIIKEKGIILQFIKETYTVEQYNADVFGTLVKPLTQDEYDLLKEVLL